MDIDANGATSLAVLGAALLWRHWDLRRQLRAVKREAVTDDATGIYNRAGLMADLHRRVRHHEPFWLLMLDLDRFKPINDTYGHEVGDAVLAATAARLNGITRPRGLAARLGGDEFVVVAGADSRPDHMAEQAVAAVRQPVPLGGLDVTVDVSVGVALRVPYHSHLYLRRRSACQVKQEVRGVLRAADEAMLRAKTSGCSIAFDIGGALLPVVDAPAQRPRDARKDQVR